VSTNQLLIFLKAPRAGLVKTRLARDLGADAACQAYRELVETLLGRVGSLREVTLCFTPDDALADIQPWLKPEWRAVPQGEGDLGVRLQAAFQRAFAAGAQRVVVIGSDCPEVTERDVRQVWSALENHDVVVGPALDGGYWLIGLRAAQPQLFAGIEWGSENVLGQTLARVREAGLSVQLLRILTDVDTEKEWRKFVQRG
jgi:hypothetical protein